MATITTFFSYKGGAGRSTTCLNTIPFLAQITEAYKNAPILLLDMDIESAGMTYLLEKDRHFHDAGYDIKEFLKGEETWPISGTGKLEDHPLYQKFVPVGNMFGLEDDYAVMFLGVNDKSDQYDKNNSGNVEEVMLQLSRFADRNGIRAIVMDSAAGDQNSARLSVNNSDKIVFCMKATRQFRVGTFNYLQKLAKRWDAGADEREIILLPTVIPGDIEIGGESQKDASIADIRARLNGSGVNRLDIKTDFISEDMFGINEITRFKWKEEVLYKLGEELTVEEAEGRRRYEHLAELVAY
ncbi:MAG: hypothetical protein E7516_07690 [Ruminococcaceae bacterium]|nr:hypothetical protein [Oscillospiraceae bacterium]